VNRITQTLLREIVPRSPIFTTEQVAKATGSTSDIASRALGQLERLGLITRLVRGLWADTKHPDFSPYAVVPFLLQRGAAKRAGGEAGYVSFLSALHLHEMLSQIPREIHVAVGIQRPAVRTPVGHYRFHQLQADLLDGHSPGDAYGRFELATPTKALFDTLYLSARRGRQFSRLPELEVPATVRKAEMRHWISRIAHPSFRSAVAMKWEDLQGRQPARRVVTGRRPT
jgi:predicted transcriptional regulator of viral defense system